MTRCKTLVSVPLGLAALALAACSPKLATLKVAPAHAVLEAKNETASFKAQQLDDSGKPLTKAVPLTWTSDNPSVASVASTGIATAQKTGHATLTASAGKVKATAAVEVHLPAKIVGQDVKLNAIGKTQDVAFQVLDEDNQPMADLYTKLAVALADPKVASVSGPSSGSWTFAASLPGKTTITASVGSLSQTFSLAVELPVITEVKLAASSLKLKVGDAQPLTAKALASGSAVAGMPITYTTSDARVATVDPEGTVHALAKGKATITATSGTKSATATVNVKK